MFEVAALEETISEKQDAVNILMDHEESENNALDGFILAHPVRFQGIALTKEHVMFMISLYLGTC
jgi:hypothetical protein